MKIKLTATNDRGTASLTISEEMGMDSMDKALALKIFDRKVAALRKFFEENEDWTER